MLPVQLSSNIWGLYESVSQYRLPRFRHKTSVIMTSRWGKKAQGLAPISGVKSLGSGEECGKNPKQMWKHDWRKKGKHYSSCKLFILYVRLDIKTEAWKICTCWKEALKPFFFFSSSDVFDGRMHNILVSWKFPLVRLSKVSWKKWYCDNLYLLMVPGFWLMVNVHKNTIQIPVGELQFNRYYKFQCRRKVKCYVLLNLKKQKTKHTLLCKPDLLNNL